MKRNIALQFAISGALGVAIAALLWTVIFGNQFP